MASINWHIEDAKQYISIKDVNDMNLPDAFNVFFSLFERFDFTEEINMLRETLTPQKEIWKFLQNFLKMCVDRSQLPSIWKTSTIIPIPKTKKHKELIEFRRVALVSFVRKSLEKIIKEEIVSLVSGKLDLLQFACQSSKGVDDAKLFILDRVDIHLEKTGC